MRRLLICILPLFLLFGCSTIKQIPVQTIEKIEYRDSLVYIRDTVTVEVPVEKIIQVLPQDTTSEISTSLAFSRAKIEQGKLHHYLEQKGQIKAKIDTVLNVQYVDRIVEREIPIITEVEKNVIPIWVWWSVVANVIVLCFISFKIYIKLK